MPKHFCAAPLAWRAPEYRKTARGPERPGQPALDGV